MARPHELLLVSESDVKELREMCAKGVHSSRLLKRAEILLLGNDGYTVDEISDAVGRHPNTVRTTRKRYIDEGLEGAIFERPRPGKPQKIFTKEEALITTIACSEVPEGRSSWTLRMIADKFVQLGEVDKISPETVRKVLKKVNSNRGKKRNGV